MITENPNAEVIICGDFNINAKTWSKKEEDKSNYEKSFNKMSSMIKDKLIDNGMILINNKETRNKALLDHIYTNKIDKIESINQDDNTTSDHSLLEFSRNMKINKIEETLIETRNFKKIDYEKLNNDIMNNEKYLSTLEEDDTEIIAENIINIINDEMDNQSILRKIKIKEKEEKKYTDGLIELIEKKNDIYKEYSINKDNEKKNELKNLKAIIKKEKTK